MLERLSVTDIVTGDDEETDTDAVSLEESETEVLTVCVFESVGVTDPHVDGVTDRETVTVTDPVTLGLPLCDSLADVEGDALTERDDDGVGDVDALTVVLKVVRASVAVTFGDAVRDTDTDVERVRIPDADRVTLSVPVRDDDCDAVRVPDPDTVFETELLAEGEPVPDTVFDTLALLEGVPDADVEGDAAPEAVVRAEGEKPDGDDESDGDRDGEIESDGVSLRDVVTEGDLLVVPVTEPLGDSLGLPDGDKLALRDPEPDPPL